MREEMGNPFEAKKRQKVKLEAVTEGRRVAASMSMMVDFKYGEN